MKIILKTETTFDEDENLFIIDVYLESDNRHATSGFIRNHVCRFYGETAVQVNDKLVDWLNQGISINLGVSLAAC